LNNKIEFYLKNVFYYISLRTFQPNWVISTCKIKSHRRKLRSKNKLLNLIKGLRKTPSLWSTGTLRRSLASFSETVETLFYLTVVDFLGGSFKNRFFMMVHCKYIRLQYKKDCFWSGCALGYRAFVFRVSKNGIT
jgi:hypothetical protein